jgi:hypothetical protein
MVANTHSILIIRDLCAPSTCSIQIRQERSTGLRVHLVRSELRPCLQVPENYRPLPGKLEALV